MAFEWIPFVAGPVGALVGAGVTYRLSRPRVFVTIDGIHIRPNAFAANEPVSVDQDLQQAFRRYPINIDGISDVSVPEGGYVTYLQRLSVVVRKRTERLQFITEAAELLQGHVARNDLEAAVEAYKYRQEPLYMLGEGEARRGRAIFRTPRALEPDLPSQISARDSGHLIYLDGPVNLQFPVNPKRSAPAVAISSEFSRRLAFAFFERNVGDLTDYFNALKSAGRDQMEESRNLEEQIARELAKFRRLEVSLLIANTGRFGMSVGADARIVLHLKGYTYSDGSVQRTVTKPLALALQVRTEERVADLRKASIRRGSEEFTVDADLYEQTDPIVVPAGATLRLRGSSTVSVIDHEQASAIEAAFGRSERSLSVELVKFVRPLGLPRYRSPLRVVRSRKVPFRHLSLES